MSTGVSTARRGAEGKVRGRTRFAGDYKVPDCLHAAPIRASIAFGKVLSLDCVAARALEGVVGVFTYEDVPPHKFASPGHPWSMDPAFRDWPEKRIFTDEIKYHGDMMGCVVARDKDTAMQAARLVQAKYESHPPVLRGLDALIATTSGIPSGHRAIHPEFADNVFAGSDDELGAPPAIPPVKTFNGTFSTQIVQHCALENHTCTAWVDSEGVLTLVSATQAPHSARRIVAEALGLPVHRVRVIKPAVGGGFGSKQDLILEPAAAFLSLQLDGRPVRLAFEREDTFVHSRTRHAAHMKLTTGVDESGRLATRELINISDSGGYPGHGHLVCMLGGSVFRQFYGGEHVVVRGRTVFTNHPPAGAMRGYGVPQVMFALESHMDDIAMELAVDPIALRLDNVRGEGEVDPLSGVRINTSGFARCLERGMALCRWHETRDALQGQSGPIRRGLGMAGFMYPTGTAPGGFEIASARVALQEDGTVQLDVGATDVGQGSDTAFVQMAAEALGVSVDLVHIASEQDTRFSPFDLGAFASRQSYVTGQAVKKVALALRDKIFAFAARLLGASPDAVTLQGNRLCVAGHGPLSLADMAKATYYHRELAEPLAVYDSITCTDSAFAYGATFAEVEVNIPLCQVEVIRLHSVLDCGRIINPTLAMSQLYGGASMGLGYALYEELRFDPDTGRAYNNNLLDYKIMTTMDTPDLSGEFVETDEPTGPFGNKALAEPVALSQAPAVRNAVLHATGVGINSLPLSPQRLFTAFKQAGLLA